MTLPAGKVADQLGWNDLGRRQRWWTNCNWRNLLRQQICTAVGNATYAAPAGSALVAADSSVRQGMLEGSNVSPTEGVVRVDLPYNATRRCWRAPSARSTDS